MTTLSDEKNYIKKNQQLPKEIEAAFKTSPGAPFRDQLIRELVRANWTYEAISNASGLTRERVRQIAKTEKQFSDSIRVRIPEPPVKPERPKREYVEPSAKTLARLLELQPYAQQVRSNGPRYRKEAEEYTNLLNYAHVTEGVTLYRLAKRLGITHGAIRFRLARYGYIKPKSGKSKVYNPIIKENRVL